MAAPTGCYKCGRPGHWSRDCPSSAPNPIPNSSASTASATPSFNNVGGGGGGGGAPNSSSKTFSVNRSSEKPKKVVAPRTRPKLTPGLLLSDDGLGYVLRHFPRSFKYRGRGHEVRDLGNLIGMYSEWHSRLLPYYSFDQFVHKVEQVAATKRVKLCLRELRERVASGGDPTKLHEPPVEPGSTQDKQDMNSEGLGNDQGVSPSKNNDAENIQADMLEDIFEKAIEEPSQTLQSDTVPAEELPNQASNDKNSGSSSSESQITEEQKARMEANRLKALEKAAARARSLQVS
ncbi:uncharacterized protein LOC107429616 [Ziziphus jujuba]|uniref:Uncharacterized protein LOC107429616 n=1 Tax=Ziziphus jujuba TaxID=326968 RepID=A0A6P6GI68_ZIZJJ|nr:uncharacterized protein LOC107429616 [Ziziphus jujuba]